MSDLNTPAAARRDLSDGAYTPPVEAIADAPARVGDAPLPRTLFVWLAIIVFVWTAPVLLPKRAVRVGQVAAAARAGGDKVALTSDAFKQMLSAETVVRSYFGFEPLLSAAGRKKGEFIASAVEPLEKVAKQTGAPSPARRALIVRHLRGDTLSDERLQAYLAPNLKKSGASPQAVTAERALWLMLYASPKPHTPPASLAAEDKRIREMRLGFLQPRVLADLYRAGGDKKQAARFEAELERASARHLARMVPLLAFNLVATIAGLALLGVFGVAALEKNWSRVGRVATVPQTLAWGELLDAFAFYLACFQGFGLLAGTFAARYIAALSPREALLFAGGVQIVTGLASLAYLAQTCRRRGVSLAAAGLTTSGKSLASQIGYGVLGWCASLPILIALGFINQKIFQNTPDLTPNPILPLMLSERNLTGRLLIFGMASLAAPFFEEAFFRGTLFGALRQRFAWVPAALFSGVIFALLHPKADWIPIIGLGFTFATMREMRQSLVPGITAHFLQNTITFLTISAIYGS